MLWLTSPHLTTIALPAAWLIETGARPGNLVERSSLRRGLAQRIVAQQLGLTPEMVTISHDARGRPLIETPAGTGLHLSLATRGGIVAVALADRPVGIDVERVDRGAALPLAALHPAEAAMLEALPERDRPLAFARLWSAKEAYVKALGLGFVRAPESFAVTWLPHDRFSVADPSRGAAVTGAGRTIENGGQEILAAAIVVLD